MELIMLKKNKNLLFFYYSIMQIRDHLKYFTEIQLILHNFKYYLSLQLAENEVLHVN